MFPLEHGEALAREIPGARLLTLEETGHGVERADWETIARAILAHTVPGDRGWPPHGATVRALAKRYGWGIHIDSHGRVALVAVESEEYQRLAADPALRHVRAFRTKRA